MNYDDDKKLRRFMGRAAIAKFRIFVLSGARRVHHDRRNLSKIAARGEDDHDDHGEIISNNYGNDIKDSSCWVPHPKSGIYFPKGHEWVMKDVPDGAASLGQTFWLRGVEGVEKPHPDDHQLPTDHHYNFHANM
ncbi:hypothetical protein CCACVL1_17064 [Corchorus capsularis]|uniref:Uncharacterized protein n=1 Tax=Corchorus capsularis TaxID=210143 RepID=A0A1R3HU74_COCAP|nr:hypothetical protein CCACVL1_17064 [Corchorus capsularis]